MTHHYLKILQQTNEELEMEIQIAQDEREKLEKQFVSMRRLLNEFERVCSGKASDPMEATIRKWRSLKKRISKNEAQ